MSIIQKIRDKAAVLLTTAIALSLIGFLVQDAFIGKSGGFTERSNSVGTINGKDIDAIEFNNKVNMAEQGYRQQGMQTNELVTQNIIESIWNSYVQENLIKTETEKLGLALTSKEMGALLFSNDAPQEFKQLFTNPNTGVYDIAAATTWFNNLKKSKKSEDLKMVNDQLINPLQTRLLTEKYNSLFTQGAYVPGWMVEKMNADNSSFASISFVAVPYATISDSLASLKVTDAEINTYVKDHAEEFKQEKTRSISYVVFDATPSLEDSSALFTQLTNLKKEFEEATDAKAFVARNSSAIPFFDGYTLKSKMQMGEKDNIIALPPGGVLGPYLDAGNYVLAKKIDVRSVPDSVHVRHILISTNSVDQQTGQASVVRPDSAAAKTADSVFNLLKGGADFKTLAAAISDDPGSKNNGGEYNFSSMDMGNLAKEFADFAFYRRKGEREIVKTSFGYHIIEILNQKNFEDAYKIAYVSKKILASEETDNTASSAATQFAANARDAKSFDEMAAKMNLTKRVADNVREMDYSVGGMPSRALVKWIYDNKAGTVSEPFDLRDKYVVALVTGVYKEGPQSAATARFMVEPILRNKKKAAEIVKKAGNNNTLEAISSATGTGLNQADTVRFADPFIPNLGSEPKVIGAAFDKSNLSKVSGAIEGQNGVYYIKVNQTGALPSANLNPEQQRSSMEAQLKQFAGFSTIEALRKSAKIEDKRREAGF